MSKIKLPRLIKTVKINIKTERNTASLIVQAEKFADMGLVISAVADYGVSI